MNRIKEIRESHGKKQMDLAKELNVSQGTLSNWERGVHDPDTESLLLLSKKFEVTTDYLLGQSNDPSHTIDPDDEVWELRREMAERPEMKTLFSLAKTATVEDINFANDMLKKFKRESE